MKNISLSKPVYVCIVDIVEFLITYAEQYIIQDKDEQFVAIRQELF